MRIARAADHGLVTLALAIAADALWGEPPACCHPVALMGRAIATAERHAPRAPVPALAFGAALALGGTAACGLATWLLIQAMGRAPTPLRLASTALLLKSTFAMRALDDAAGTVGAALAHGDLLGAREALRALVSRDASVLHAPLISAAAVESVAENLSDSFLAPLFWYTLLGLPGAVAYRFVNTCDAMLGYRGRYEYLGKAAARLDDAANWLPARLTALLLVIAARLIGADGRGAWRVMWRHHARTASPNAGWPMSAAAGALGVRLEKMGHYTLGDGPRPGPSAIPAAVALARTAAALALSGYVCWALARRCDAAAA
ncbi:MAG TPA: adenosylcobinamide-phosphate synthase CbiB [Chloroflexota bacterium]